MIALRCSSFLCTVEMDLNSWPVFLIVESSCELYCTAVVQNKTFIDSRRSSITRPVLFSGLPWSYIVSAIAHCITDYIGIKQINYRFIIPTNQLIMSNSIMSHDSKHKSLVLWAHEGLKRSLTLLSHPRWSATNKSKLTALFQHEKAWFE